MELKCWSRRQREENRKKKEITKGREDKNKEKTRGK
jgi:hypothetical protein